MSELEAQLDEVDNTTGAVATDDAVKQPAFELTSSRQFTSWLVESGGSLAFTTYQAGKILLLGTKSDGSLSIFNRNLNRCMGIAVKDSSLFVGTLTEIVRFENAMSKNDHATQGEDALFVPQMCWYTGDMDIHDLAIGDDGLIFVNTLFSCLGQPSVTHSFKRLWQPSFIDRLAAEDRCHLNGVAMRNGAPAYVTAVAETNIADGWRDHRRDGGIVIDVQTGEIAARGLSMPHSPRWYRDRLWVLNSGEGTLGYIDTDQGAFVPLAFCPGYLRGLTFHENYAIVGLSEPRGSRTFADLPLQARLDKEAITARCGLYVIDLETGDIVHWARISGVVKELYDVAFMGGVRNPAMIGFHTGEIRRIISIDQ
ncbi:MAG: TIGR03032 family protein [Alphaproteobacteria bacterium]